MEEDKMKIKTGICLIAKPFWDDNTYKRSVIFIVEHSEEGSVGIILNKESNLDVHTALPEINVKMPLFYGGNFNKNLIVPIYTKYIHDAVDIGGGFYLGGDYDELQLQIKNKKLNPRHLRFCAGSVQWDAGQLEEEVKDGKWWVTKITANEYFGINTESLWSNKLISEGHIYGIMNDFPDPSLN